MNTTEQQFSQLVRDNRSTIYAVCYMFSNDADEVAAVASGLGARLVTSPIAATGRPGQHDALRLAAAYRDLMG